MINKEVKLWDNIKLLEVRVLLIQRYIWCTGNLRVVKSLIQL